MENFPNFKTNFHTIEKKRCVEERKIVSVSIFPETLFNRALSFFLKCFFQRNSLNKHKLVVLVVVIVAKVSKRTKKKNTKRREKKTWQLVYWIDLLWPYNDVFCGLKYTKTAAQFPFYFHKPNVWGVGVGGWCGGVLESPLFFTKRNKRTTFKQQQQQQ